jgi:hypothetical protein
MKIALAAACLLSVCALSAAAQTRTATLKVKVLGPDGNPMQGAQVTLATERVSEVEPHTATTNDSGEMAFSAITPGTYKVTVETTGFKTIIVESLSLAGGDAQESEFIMETGAPQETITIAPEHTPAAPPPSDR